MLLSSILDPSAPPGQLLDYGSLDATWRHLAPAVRPALIGLAVAAAVSLVMIKMAPRMGLVKRPSRERDIHRRTVALGGGVGLYAGFAVAALLSLPHDRELAAILGLTGVSALIYLYDDRFGMRPLLKLALQVVIAVAAVGAFGFAIGNVNLGVARLTFGLLALPLTVLWIVGMQNTINLIDGVDGLAAGVVAIVALVLMIAATPHLDKPGQRETLLLAAILAGACVGFLVFNFHPARIFMGDSGSQFLGLTLALLAILGVAKVAVAAALLVPLVALAVPIADTAWAVVRRRRRGVSIAHADSGHVHYRLLDFGLSQRETCLLFYAATAVLGAAGLSVFGHRRILAVVVAVVVVVVAVFLSARLRVGRRRVLVPGGRIVRLIQERRARASL